MVKRAIIGTQFGDEGKAKMIGYFVKTGDYDVIGRYGGGRNAGHSQIDDKGKEVINHLIPGGILHSGVYNVVLADVMVDPLGLIDEIREIEGKGHKVTPDNFGISNRAQMTLKYHKDFEEDSERMKGKDAIGTTKRGIGPTAISKYGREPVMFEEFLDPETFKTLLSSFSREHGNVVAKSVNVDEYVDMYGKAIEFLRPFMVEEAEFIRRNKDKNWLYEGAQGIMLDVLYGSHPYVTSSTPYNPPSDTDERVGIMKAYITRVGNGNLPTRMDEKDERLIRGILKKTPGAEFGATTGRPRNCGWFDAVIARHSTSIGRIDRIALTKLDRLSGFPVIKLATAYKYKGSVIKSLPGNRFVFEKVTPLYKEVPGWMEDISHVREFKDMPSHAQDYVKGLQDFVECKISHISVGPRAEQTIKM